MSAIVFIVAAIVTAYLAVRLFPEATRRWFNRAMAARKTILGVVAVIVAFAFVASGYPPLVILGFLMFVYIALYLFFEEPHEEVWQWL